MQDIRPCPFMPARHMSAVSSINRFFWKEFGTHCHQGTKYMLFEDSSGFMLGEMAWGLCGEGQVLEEVG